MNKQELQKVFKDYQDHYLITMGWNMQETFEEWFQRLKDIDSPLINDDSI